MGFAFCSKSNEKPPTERIQLQGDFFPSPPALAADSGEGQSQEFVTILQAINDGGLDQVVMETVELHGVTSDAKPPLTTTVCPVANLRNADIQLDKNQVVSAPPRERRTRIRGHGDSKSLRNLERGQRA